MGANTFRSGPHPKWVPMGPKLITKTFDLLGHPKPKIRPFESTQNTVVLFASKPKFKKYGVLSVLNVKRYVKIS